VSEPKLPARATLPQAQVTTMSAQLLASWQRSEEYGVPLESVEPVFVGTLDDESLFFQCGKEVLTDLAQTLASEPVSLMLTDADGLVLNRVSGDQSLLRALDDVHLAPGFSYAEREAGTNGLGLALADRIPTIVRAEQHYSLSLCTYTCAAVPVLDPHSGRLEGAVNLTTWSSSSTDLLLALARSAASTLSAMMLARSHGQRPRPAARGEVFRVETPRLEPGSGTLDAPSAAWAAARHMAEGALDAGRVVAALGESGAGRATLLAQALRRLRPRCRILAASAPAPQDVEAWMALWTPELAKPDTGIVVCNVDALPLWAVERLRDLVLAARRATTQSSSVPFCITAERFEDIPAPLAPLIETVVRVPPLRERPDDILPLARHFAFRVRGRDVALSRAAERALRAHPWPGNVEQLASAMRHAATRAEAIDVQHLPPELLARSSFPLSRIQAFERDEIVRMLLRPGMTMHRAVRELGMSRATIYRKIALYDIQLPK
jgi:transcriptional regulator of acetoin/glycerol metabolism